jgi:hypothetical protein
MGQNSFWRRRLCLFCFGLAVLASVVVPGVSAIFTRHYVFEPPSAALHPIVFDGPEAIWAGVRQALVGVAIIIGTIKYEVWFESDD